MNTVKRGKAWSLLGAFATVALALSGCGKASTDEPSTDATQSSQTVTTPSSDTYFTTDEVHSIDIDLDQADYEAMLTTYAETGDKEWVTVTATIDGNTFEDVGLRLKGNSSLRTALATSRGIELSEEDLENEGSDSGDSPSDAAAPETIPWLIRLNKYVDGQNYLGRYDFVVRGNDTESSLNEAVAMAMLEEAGLATHRVAFTAFSVNGSEAIWKQRTGEDDMTPIVEFMDFINNSSDETFEDSLGEYLDLDQFAKYLAVEDMINNWDTISGMGNNGYLHYDPSTGMMTLIAWDHDRAFESHGAGMGGMPGDGGGGVGGGPGGAPGTNAPGDNAPDGNAAGARGSNILETRFRASDTFMEMYNKAYAELTVSLIDSGFAQDVLDQYTELLITQASDLVSPDTVESDAKVISNQLTSDKEEAKTA